MTWAYDGGSHSLALIIAGLIGSGTALVHGYLTQLHLVPPRPEYGQRKGSPSARRLIAALLHFSTFNWFVGGLFLVFAAGADSREVRIAVGALVASSYLYGAIGNLWATRGRHPGWVVYGICVMLIVYGLTSGPA
jgi:hypothetical protein